MVKTLAVRLVDWCWRHAWTVVIASLVATVLMGWYAAAHLSLDTDESKLISQDLPFRQVEKTIEQAFPHSADRLAVIIDGPTAELAEDAVEKLAKALPAAHKGLIFDASRPAEEMFFRKNGLLFMPAAELGDIVERLVQAQPLLGSIAKDPSLRGLLASVDLVLQGIAHGQAQPKDIEPLITQLDKPAADVVAHGKAAPVDWQGLMSGGPAKDAPRRFLMVHGKLDYGALEPASDVIDAVRATARDLGLEPANGYKVSITGSLALSDANFATVAEGVEISAPLSFLAVLLLLFWGVRSGRVVAAIVISLIIGLVATAAFAAAAVGSLNPISVAFAVMFVGIAVDFGIQFVTAFRNERFLKGDPAEAVLASAASMAAPLSLAAIATAVGFLSFLPTAYTGVSQLGLIAGGGMLIALVVDFTLLPALLALLKPHPEAEPVGLKLQAADAALRRHAKPIVAGGCVVGLIGAVLLPIMPLDFDPLHLQDPKAEAVKAFLELAQNPDNGVYNVETLAPSVDAARVLAEKFEALPEVHRAMTVATFVPDGQDEKLAMIADVAMVLGPTLNPAKVLPAPSPEELLAAIVKLAGQLETVAPDHKPSQALAGRLKAIAAKGPQAAEAYQKAVAAGLPALLSGIRRSLDAEAVSLDSLPPDLKREWVSADGRARVQVLPKIDMQNQEARNRFNAAVTKITPNMAGAPISMEQSGQVVIGAFAIAAIGALAAIGLLLGLMLRRVLDSALVLAPLVLGALATVIAARAAGIAINFANVIALPLLLGIGVAFNIYFVVNWRNGVTDHLSSPTTRAVLFSALTTGSAFGSLAVSPHLGTASMGMLLFLSLGVTVAATFVVLPALFHLIGKPK
ncbi:putative membrane protein actII-3 [Magnetospirillum sp. XM-1]|uniref:MMPL family transporter n=1 Tax=Magnetospirillum sp. XM-1 TaxID=1663591 RepID=UPI00073DC424|nr:MMPL family transporter [Magnetospirillum sp. XM-1]CUW39196.1 putative membrane protein actII-3 [Magnetospirillum sp. XM-1]